MNRTTTGLGAAVSLDVTQISTVNVSLSYDRVERSGNQTGTDKGFSGEIGWVRQMTNGSLGVSYGSDVSSNSDGRRSFLNASRSLELPRGSCL